MNGAPFELDLWLSALPLLMAAATVTWLLSLPLRNAGIIEPLWSLMLFAAGVVYALGSDPRAPRLSPVLWLCALWAARMAWHRLRRFTEQSRQPPHRAFRSLYQVFWPRALCAWVVSLPLMGAFASLQAWGPVDCAGVALWVVGFAFQTVADWQLRRFKSDPVNADAVLSRGLWQFSRHPNLFGECCVWLGFGAFAVSAGAWWALPGTALMTWLLLRAARPGGNGRPHYADYVLKTNVFFPGRRRN